MAIFGLLTDTGMQLQPSYMFTDKDYRGPFEFSDELGNLSIAAESADNVVPAQGVEANDKDLLLSTSEKEEIRGPTFNGSGYSAPLYDSSAASVQSELAIISSTSAGSAPSSSLASDDLLGLGLSAAPAPEPALVPPSLKLNSKAILDPGTFQQKWRQLPISLSQVYLPFLTLILFFCFFIFYFNKWQTFLLLMPSSFS